VEKAKLETEAGVRAIADLGPSPKPIVIDLESLSRGSPSEPAPAPNSETTSAKSPGKSLAATATGMKRVDDGLAQLLVAIDQQTALLLKKQDDAINEKAEEIKELQSSRNPEQEGVLVAEVGLLSSFVLTLPKNKNRLTNKHTFFRFLREDGEAHEAAEG